MIPRILHQTWKTREIPAEWQTAVDSWLRYHPDWEYRLWTNEDGYRFVEQHYPELLGVYRDYPYDILRADVIRYLVLHRHGGLYADMDYECLQPFDQLLAGKHFLAGCEPPEHHRVEAPQEVICNALIAAEPGSGFLARVIDTLQHQQVSMLTPDDVLNSTGPLLLQRVLDSTDPSEVDILPSRVLCPLSYRSRALGYLKSGHPRGEQVRQLLREQGCYAVHYWSNSWVDNLSATPLVNPDPHGVPGFTFHPGQDPIDNDLFNGGRDIPRLAEQCLADGRVVAFNTDGFAKGRLKPRDQWTRVDNPDGKCGLYVKDGGKGKKPV